MNKDQLEKAVKYQTLIKNRLESPVPQKHAGHPEQFKAFLKRELKMVTAEIDAAKLEMSGK